MSVPPGPLLALRHGGDQVPRRDHGVRGERVALDPAACRHHPDERLLHEILGDVRVADPGAHYSADQRQEVEDRVFDLGFRAFHLHPLPHVRGASKGQIVVESTTARAH